LSSIAILSAGGSLAFLTRRVLHAAHRIDVVEKPAAAFFPQASMAAVAATRVSDRRLGCNIDFGSLRALTGGHNDSHNCGE
jgi:hypothetical protein